jgi:hypothetical protein
MISYTNYSKERGNKAWELRKNLDLKDKWTGSNPKLSTY